MALFTYLNCSCLHPSRIILLVYYIMKATNNKKYSDLGFRLFTRASKKQNKISKKKNPKIFD